MLVMGTLERVVTQNKARVPNELCELQKEQWVSIRHVECAWVVQTSLSIGFFEIGPQPKTWRIVEEINFQRNQKQEVRILVMEVETQRGFGTNVQLDHTISNYVPSSKVCRK